MNTQNEWIDNVTGVCPVAEGTLIDVVYRDGEEMLCKKALKSETGDRDTTKDFWDIDHDYNDIISWRLHKSEQTNSLEDAYDYVYPHSVQYGVADSDILAGQITINQDNHEIIMPTTLVPQTDILIAFNKMTGHTLTEDELNTLKILLEVFWR